MDATAPHPERAADRRSDAVKCDICYRHALGSRKLASVLPNSRLRTVPGSGHSIYFENAPVFNQLVRDFLLEVGYAK